MDVVANLKTEIDIMNTTQRTYFELACSHLVAFGGYGGNTKRGRWLCARALRSLSGIERRQACRHLYFISGMLPEKEASK